MLAEFSVPTSSCSHKLQAAECHQKMSFTFSDISVEALRMELSSFASERDWHKFHTPRNLLLCSWGRWVNFRRLFQWRSDKAPNLDYWTGSGAKK